MSQLNDWLPVLRHADNLEAVLACTPLCTAYNKGLTSGLLIAANAGKHAAIPLLADVFRCCIPLVLYRVAQSASNVPYDVVCWPDWTLLFSTCCCKPLAVCTNTLKSLLLQVVLRMFYMLCNRVGAQ